MGMTIFNHCHHSHYTFPSGTLSFSGETMAIMSLVFVSTTLLAEDARENRQEIHLDTELFLFW